MAAISGVKELPQRQGPRRVAREPPPAALLLPAALPAALPSVLGAWLDVIGWRCSPPRARWRRRGAGGGMVTLAFLALGAGVGGGTMSDLPIGAPVFWVRDTRAVAACLLVARLIRVTPVSPA